MLRALIHGLQCLTYVRFKNTKTECYLIYNTQKIVVILYV